MVPPAGEPGELAGQGTGGAGASGDIGGTGAQQRAVGAPWARREPNSGHRAALGRAYGSGWISVAMRDWWFRIGSRWVSDKLCLNGGGADEDGLPGEDGRPLGHSPDVAGEAEVGADIPETLRRRRPFPEIGDIPPHQSTGFRYSR